LNTDTRKHIVVVGGGISGLAAAHRLTELNTKDRFRITLLEAGTRLGGVIKTERDGFLLEGGPDAFISEKPEALALAERLGLTDRLIPTNEQFRRSFVVRKGKLRPIPEGFQLLAPSRFWPFATSSICSLTGKLRMAGEVFLPQRWNDAEDESLASFVRRRFGQEALERLAQPLVGGIYTADPERLSLRATMPRFLEMERKYGSVIRAMLAQRSRRDAGTSGARYSLFLSFDEGMQVLTDALAARLPENAVRFGASVEAMKLMTETGQWECTLNDGSSIRADAVCLALPAHTTAGLMREHDPSLADDLSGIEYASTATINLAFRASDVAHPLNGFGFVVPVIEGRSVLACTFCSVKFAGRAPEGQVLLRAFAGGALQPEVFALDDDEILRRVLADLNELLGITARPLFTRIARWAHSMPQYHLGHQDRIVRIQARMAAIPTLALAGNAFGGAGIPDCVRSGEAAAETLSRALRS
jgi:oxygen-dependent protoporphyrinogen oxidase